MKSIPVSSEQVNAKLGRGHRHTRDSVDVLVFLIPCLRFIEVKVIGILDGSDLLLLLLFIILGLRKEIKVDAPLAKRCLILCSLWLASQCVTDIVRHSAFADYARGWSAIGFTLITFSVVYTFLYGRPRRIVIYGWGLVVGELLTFLISPDQLAQDYPWKFGLAYPLTLAVVLIASRKACRGHWPITLSMTIGVINVALGARARGGFCLAAALYLLVVRYQQRKGMGGGKLKRGTIVTIAASLILGAVGILGTYQYAARSGILGEDARAKFEVESSGKYGVLLGGRTEALSYVPAIIDSPILGHGSFAKDPTYIIAQRQALLMMGYVDALDISPDEIEEGIIPSHSYLFGAWVSAGILGAFFWGWVFVMTLKVLLKVYGPGIVLPAIVPWIAFELLWAILFSPYGSDVRIIAPYYIVILMGYNNVKPQMRARIAKQAVLRTVGPQRIPLT